MALVASFGSALEDDLLELEAAISGSAIWNSHMFAFFVLSGTVITPFHSANTFVISWNGRLSAVSVPPFLRRTTWIIERQKTAALQGELNRPLAAFSGPSSGLSC